MAEINVTRESAGPHNPLEDHYTVVFRNGKEAVVDCDEEPRFKKDFIQVGDNWFAADVVAAILGDGVLT